MRMGVYKMCIKKSILKTRSTTILGILSNQKLDKVLGRIKKIIGLEKFDDTKNVVNADDK